MEILKVQFLVIFFLALGETEVALQRCSEETLFWKYTANLQENIHVEVQFQ